VDAASGETSSPGASAGAGAGAGSPLSSVSSH
jgi:hypothetical protein